MNVGQLRAAIAHLPDNMPVLIAAECGTRDEPNLYVIPAHIEHSTYGSHVYEDHRNPPDWAAKIEADHGFRYENTTALLLSQWGSDGEDITPEQRPAIIDGEIAPKEIQA